MRTPLLAALLAFSLPACLAGEISDVGGEQGGGGGDGDGNGNGNGGGDGSGDGSGTQNTPSVALSVDKTTVTSDLGVETTITISAMSVMGFAGDVDLAVTTTGADLSPTDWTTTLADAKLTLAADATATTTVKLSAMGNTSKLAGTLKVTATSGSISADATADVTLNPVLVVTFNDTGAGKCVYPQNRGPNNPWLLTAGRKIRVMNGSPTLGLQVHTNGSISGFPHENNVTPPGQGYERTVTTANQTDEFYCHAGNMTMTEQMGSVRNFLRVVQ